MILRFDPNQSFQLDAIKSVVEIFEGQSLEKGDFELSFLGQMDIQSQMGVGNKLEITEAQILENLKKIQKHNGLLESQQLDGMHFSVEMETGTGKTYVYLRTIYELNKLYGFKKFVIVVPSIAIREGVLKNLEITHDHFQNLYGNIPLNFDVYDSRRVSRLRSFAINDAIQIMVINIDSFAKDQNIINRPNDKLTGQRPIEFIQCTNPIVIVDEPQNMETEIRQQAIENLNYLCTLRFSATHIKRYNMIYSLNPVQAYDMGLVKQIEVDSVVTKNDFNEAYVCLKKVYSTRTRTSAKVEIDIETGKGVKRKTVTLNVGDDLYELSGRRDIYRNGYIINAIDVEYQFISLSGGQDVTVGDSLGGLTDEIMKVQIDKTVQEHFSKELRLRDKGLKVLSLFFIDRVANYRSYDENGNPVKGKFAQWFEEAYQKYINKEPYRQLITDSVDQVHNGYFSQDRKGNWKDTGGISQADNDTYKLIMKDKERLLDINEPLRFIFSHSALREGWDNPNVFQICTLNETRSDLKKRQEIGRGMRLAVDQQGNRVFEKDINLLTVVANESYEDFARQLQKEIEDDCGVSFAGRTKNKNKRVKIKYRKGFELDDNFKAIWDRINHNTTYRVEYRTTDLIRDAVKEIKDLPEVRRALIHVYRSQLEFDKAGIVTGEKASAITEMNRLFNIPDILGFVQQRTGLTRTTIFEILKQSERINDILINPQLFLDNVVSAINKVLNRLMIDGIKYEKIGSIAYEMRRFDEFDIHINDLTFKIKNPDKTIYSNFIPLDSTVENKFAVECEKREDILFYMKLPYWFKIKTPIGSYNPDWALIKKNEKTVYFVAETKGKDQELRPSEEYKIKCGKAHFNELEEVTFRQVARLSDLD
ncbi:MAG: DEAD/DEAH box helicase family protein [Candidatus Marinimicrobia bacterium]|nr:DEAD/DEAH box helicase family protein [Candidatus Neomarinimicrobiota bacterium]